MAEKGKDSKPYIPADKVLPELTAKVIILGSILAIVMGAANAYLGLKAGMTVSASIPAAVISMVIMRWRYLNGNILENNMVKTMAAAGEALAAGVIFTIPALLVIYELTSGTAGWKDLTMDQYLIITVPVLIGGMLGVLFTIPLRRILIVDLDLPYPEGVACTEVLITGEKGGAGLTYVFTALGMGMTFKLAASAYGLNLWKESIIGIMGSGKTKVFAGSDLSTALLGVGYIIGPKIAFMVFSGGILGWVILLPLVGAVKGYPLPGDAGIFALWRSDTMYVGIGAIIVGGLYTLVKMRAAIVKGVTQTFSKGKKLQEGETAPIIERTERDFPINFLYFVVIAVGMAAFYWYLFENAAATAVATGAMFVFAFFFTAVAGYIAGVVGSSNNPISGVTVATLLFTAIILSLMVDMNTGMTATILVAAIVCCSAAIAGDCMQELKTGQLLGSTPRNLQVAEFIGVLVSAIILAPVVISLHKAYGIGTLALPAPQARVMGTVVYGVFTGHLNYMMLTVGVILAFVIIVLEHLDIAHISIMAVAIGIYLPFTLTVPIMFGGIILLLVMTFTAKRIRRMERQLDDEALGKKVLKDQDEAMNRGILIASGLVAGEALMGVIIAVCVISGLNLNVIGNPVAWPGLLLFIYIALYLGYMAMRDQIGDLKGNDFWAVTKETLMDPLDRKK